MAEENGITIDEHKFRMHVVESLTRLETLAQSTDARLARLNGSVACHEERIHDLQQMMDQHQVDCPMRETVETLRAAIISDEAEHKASASWWRAASPLLWLIVGGVLVLFLVHSKEMLRVFSKP